MRTTWTFHSATQLLFGAGAAAQTGEVVHRLGAKRAFVVTDANLERVGIVSAIREPLAAAGVDSVIFAEGMPEPSLELAERCCLEALSAGCDVVVGLGGGSNMDVAKIVANIVRHGGHPRDYFGEDRIPGPVAPLVCIPTTAGTGSEVSSAAVVTDAAQGMKVSSLSNYLRPTAAIVDPLLTLSCPPRVTADSGIDALTHAIEAYTAVDNAKYPLPAGERSVYQGLNPLGDLVAEKAIELVGQYLRRAYQDGSDREAREGMALAATLGGLAFSNVGVALVHALEYPVGVLTHCSHGAGNGLLLPFVMRFNLAVRFERFAKIAALLGEDTRGLAVDDAAERALSAVEKLRADIGIPLKLEALGVRRDQLRGLAEKAFGVKRLLRVNPRPATVEEIEQIFAAAW